jgi:hypothetical protein
MGVEVDLADVNLNRAKGRAPGPSMNVSAVIIAGTVLAGAFAGGNSYYLEEQFSALVLFALVALPLLTLAFCLAVVGAGAERGMAWAKARSVELAASLRRLTQASRQRPLLDRSAASVSSRSRTEESADPSADYSFVATRLPPPAPHPLRTHAREEQLISQG